MKSYIPAYLLLLLLISCTDNKQTEKPTYDSQPPNILLILVDDLGFSDLGCYGGEIATPNIDKLAFGGIRFTQFHNTSKCFPSRACLLTGLYAQQVGNARKPDTLRNSFTLAEMLKTAGYRTLMVGKHHGKENMYFRGFDRYYGLRDGAANHFNPGEQRPGEPVPAQKVGYGFRQWCVDSQTVAPYTPPKDFYTTDYFTQYALDYLEEYKHEDQPFFLYMAYTAPHDPLQAWPGDIEKYEDSYDDGYEATRIRRYRKQLDIGLINEKDYQLSAATYEPWHVLSDSMRQVEARKMAVYAAMIDRLDQNIGRVMGKLQQLGKLENTLILFCSDNGASAEVVGARSLNESGKEGGLLQIGTMAFWASLGPGWANVSNTPYRLYKNYSHEGGICTPLIAYWPGRIKENSFTEYTGHFIDFMPTLVDLAGATYPDSLPDMPGQSLVPAFTAVKEQRDKPLFWEWGQGKAVWHKGYKLVSDRQQDWALYHLAQDKSETTNLADSLPDKVEQLSQMWQHWKEDMTAYE